MPDMPEGGFDLNWIGLKLIEMQRDMREMKSSMAEMRQQLSDHSLRFMAVESALFRADVRWNETQDDVQNLRGEVRELRGEV